MNLQLERVHLQRSMERDLGVNFITGFFESGRALIWKKVPGLGYTSQAIIDLQGRILQQSTGIFTSQEQAFFLHDEPQITGEEVSDIKASNHLDSVGPFFDERALTYRIQAVRSRETEQQGSTRRYNFINAQGEFISEDWFAEANDFSCGLGLVKSESLRSYNYLRPDGNPLLDNWLHQANSFKNNYGVIRQSDDSQFRIIDLQGHFAGDPYDLILPFSEGKALIRIGKKHNFVDQNLEPLFSKWLYPVREIDSFRCGFSLVRSSTGAYNYLSENGGWLFRDNSGRRKDLHLSDAYGFQGGFALVTDRIPTVGKLLNFMTPEGKFLTKEWFRDAQPFLEGFALVKRKNSTFNFINHEGELLHSEGFSEAHPFRDGLARVFTLDPHRQPRFIDKSGKFIQHEAIEEADDFSCGRALVKVYGDGGESRFWNYLTLDGSFLLDEPLMTDAARPWLRPAPFRDGRSIIPQESDAKLNLNWFGESIE
jgi:hypothetical protein